MARNKISTTIYVEEKQDRQLKALRDRTGVPMAVLIRDAIDVALARWADTTENVLSRAEETVLEKQREAEAAHRDPDLVTTDLDLVLSHARQLQLERDQAFQLVAQYRQALHDAQQAIRAALTVQGQPQAEQEAETGS